jgi:hypothetical protein
MFQIFFPNFPEAIILKFNLFLDEFSTPCAFFKSFINRIYLLSLYSI